MKQELSSLPINQASKPAWPARLTILQAALRLPAEAKIAACSLRHRANRRGASLGRSAADFRSPLTFPC
jgi:hypothetical protein